MKRSWIYGIVLIYTVAVFWSCSDSHQKSGLAKIQESTDTISYDMSNFAQVQDMEIAVVLSQIEELDSQFLVPTRAREISSFPCSNCHTKPLAQLKAEKIGKSAHWDISLAHANKLSMDCSTCHNMEKPDELTSLTKNSISLDHSYKQCSQCHSTQFNDWKGGAHGKRLRGWVPPRVAQTCVGCHNPHKPAFEKRWPSRLNTAKLKQEQNH
ncbi:MAG: hypothetical protein ABJG78_10985 [Cyclobacteriaceae bacterium]